jgi:polyprenyldihydroxybenzoate methyltransferase / 3-demethylubiquinol 3-O-methyltransferase
MHASLDHKLSHISANGATNGSILTYRHTTAETLVQEPGRFDVVCSMEVLEHVDNPSQFLSTCAELVKVRPDTLPVHCERALTFIQPGGHLFLSTISRTPLAYMISILAAEHIFRMVTPGTHTFSKFVKPSELISFFQEYPKLDVSQASSALGSRPWITRTYSHGLPTRTEAEIRGIIYVPWRGEWLLAPRELTSWGAVECNYLFWVRKPE